MAKMPEQQIYLVTCPGCGNKIGVLFDVIATAVGGNKGGNYDVTMTQADAMLCVNCGFKHSPTRRLVES